MPFFLASLIPLLLAVGPLLLVLAATMIWKKRSSVFRKNNPLNRDLLRGPGETLRNEIEELDTDVGAHLAAISVIPLLLYSILVSGQLISGEASISPWVIGMYAIAAVAITAFLLSRILNSQKRRRNLTLGLEAEVAVGQALNELVRDGAWIFHDFPADGFNIDHIVVSAKGIMAIETKGRNKPTDGKGKSTGWNVSYDGTALTFPGWIETDPLEQSIRQAKWLQEWISSAVGETVPAKPVLALPGWYINRENSSKGIFVINGKNPQVLVQYGQDVLPPTMIKRIVHQLDQRCRNVKPT